MYHTSAKLTFGGGENIFGGTKSSRGRQKASGGAIKLQGRKKPIRKTEKVLCRGAKNLSRGRRLVNMVNVTPLIECFSFAFKSTLLVVLLAVSSNESLAPFT